MVSADDIHVEEQQISRIERISSLVKDWQIPLGLAIISTAILIGTGRWSIPEAPEWLRQMLTVIAVGIIPATLAGKALIVDRYIPDSRYHALCVRLTEDNNLKSIKPYHIPRGVWERRERGEYPEYEPPMGIFDYVITDYHWDEEEEILSVEGCNPEIANPLSVIARDGLLKETYQELQHDRAELAELQATLESRALEIDRSNVNDLMEAVEHGARFGGSAWDEIQSEQWAQDLTPDADDRDDPEEPVEDDRPTLSDMIEKATDADPSRTPSGGVADD